MSTGERTPDWWREAMPVEKARDVLGQAHFWYCVEQGAAWCRGRAQGAWTANLPENFGAYFCAAAEAETRGIP